MMARSAVVMIAAPACVAVFTAWSCGAGPTGSSPRAASSTLPPGIVATVGSTAIPETTIAMVVRTQGVPAEKAADGEVRDALFAAAALQEGYGDAAAVRVALRGRLARARLALIGQQAAANPITDEEVEDATSHHFVELARPEAFRVIHAAVLVKENADSAEKAKAKALAQKIAERVAVATDASDFKSRAESIEDRQGFELRVETLLPVAADGRVVDQEHPSSAAHYTPLFARAASHLTEVGQKSGVVATEFGYHVMMLLERTAPHIVSLEERRAMLREEIVTERAKRMKKDLLDQLRGTSSPSIDRAADALLATVVVDANEAQ
jgi:peptidyl-prolyl cis-trans isomerase C